MNEVQDASATFEGPTPHVMRSSPTTSSVPKASKSKKGQGRTIKFWTREENILYMRFLEENLDLFKGESHKRRICRVYVQISQAVGTRTPDQCRSHHQKMMKWHRSIKGIITHVQSLPDTKTPVIEKEEQTQPVEKVVEPVSE